MGSGIEEWGIEDWVCGAVMERMGGGGGVCVEGCRQMVGKLGYIKARDT